MDFAVGLVNSVLNLLNIHVKFLGEFRRTVLNTAHQKFFWGEGGGGLGEMTFGLVHATIKDTQLGSHCFDTCLGFLPMLYCKGFLVRLLSSRPLLRAKGKRGRAQHVSVIHSVDPSSNVTDCGYHLPKWQVVKLTFFAPCFRLTEN